MSGFFEMGGYGAYVWPAYGVSVLVWLGLIAVIISRRRRLQTALEQYNKGEDKAGDQ